MVWGMPSDSTRRRISILAWNADFAGSSAWTRSTSLPNSDGKNRCRWTKQIDQQIRRRGGLL